MDDNDSVSTFKRHIVTIVRSHTVLLEPFNFGRIIEHADLPARAHFYDWREFSMCFRRTIKHANLLAGAHFYDRHRLSVRPYKRYRQGNTIAASRRH